MNPEPRLQPHLIRDLSGDWREVLHGLPQQLQTLPEHRLRRGICRSVGRSREASKIDATRQDQSSKNDTLDAIAQRADKQ